MKSVLSVAVRAMTGHLQVETTSDGIILHRVPAQARERTDDWFLDFQSTVPSGVRLVARTNSTRIEILLRVERMQLLGVPTPPQMLDVVVDGAPHQSIPVSVQTVHTIDGETGVLTPGSPTTTQVLLNLPNDGKVHDVVVWFSAQGPMRLFDVRVDDDSCFEPGEETAPRWVHHGSSISQGSEASHPLGTWPAAVAAARGLTLTNLGIGGECLLDQFMANVIRDLPASLISLEIGINVINGDAMRERVFVSSLHAFLDTVRQGHPKTPIMIVSPIICPAHEDQPGPTVFASDGGAGAAERPAALAAGALTLRRIRELLEHHISRRRSEGDQHLEVLDGLLLFRQSDLSDLPDGLHPNAAGHARIATRFADLVADRWG